MFTCYIGTCYSIKPHWSCTVLIQSMRWYLYYHMCDSLCLSVFYRFPKYLMIQWCHMRGIVFKPISNIYIYGTYQSNLFSCLLEEMISHHTRSRLTISTCDSYIYNILSWFPKLSPCKSSLEEHVKSIYIVPSYSVFIHTYQSKSVDFFCNKKTPLSGVVCADYLV